MVRAFIAIHRREIQPESPVRLAQRFPQLEDDAEVARDTVSDIAQDLEFEGVPLLRRQRSVRQLRRDGDQIGSERLDFGQRELQRPQLQIAVRSPASAIETQYQRSSCQEIDGPDSLAPGIREREGRCPVTRPETSIRDAGFREAFVVGLDDAESLLRQSLVVLNPQRFDLLVQAHR